jgi:hypothetical protein
VPTLNKYANDPGYYIRAWTRELGNFNYKINPEGWSLVEDTYTQAIDREISWQEINVLKSIGVIYTDESGIIRSDDEKFKPDPEQLEKTNVSTSDAQALFSSIVAQFDLSRQARAEIRAILGLPPETDFEAVGEQIVSHLETYMEKGTLPLRSDLLESDADELDISSWVEEDGSPEHRTWNLHVLIYTDVNDEPCFTDHCIHLCDEHGLEGWHIRILETPTWDIKGIAIQQQGIIFPKLLEGLREAEFDLGDPAEVLSPTVDWANSPPTE